MLDEKTMVADTLAGINGELVRYGEMIPQTENMQLKQVLKQFRNQCETSQEEIYQLARSKQYYVPAAKATAEEIQHVRSVLSQGEETCVCHKFFLILKTLPCQNSDSMGYCCSNNLLQSGSGSLLRLKKISEFYKEGFF